MTLGDASSQSSLDTAMEAAALVYVRVGKPLLAQVAGPHSPFISVSPEDFSNGNVDFLGFRSTNVRMALVLARMRRAEGKLANARAFAVYGLARLAAR